MSSLLYFILKKSKKIPWVIRGFYWACYIRMMGGKSSLFLLIEGGFNMKYPPHKGIIFGKKIHFSRNVNIDVPIGAVLKLGDNISFTGFDFISSASKVEIGNNVLIAEFVSIRDAYHKFNKESLIINQPMSSKNIKIGSDIWIGRGSAILRGVTIGDGVVIGANSIVKNDVESFSVYQNTTDTVTKFRL